MRTCPSCHSQNRETAKFCTSCGSLLTDQNPNGNVKFQPAGSAGKKKGTGKKGLLLAMVLLAAAVGGGTWFLAQKPGISRFQESMETAEKYLLELDYSKAEEYYLKALEIEPKNAEPYQKLYEIYLIENKEDQAAEIQDRAEENLEQEDLSGFTAAVQELEEQYYPFPDGEVIAELGKLDFAPIELNGHGWLIRNQDGYQFITPDGTIRNASEREQGTVRYPSDTAFVDLVLNKFAESAVVDHAFYGSGRPNAGGPKGMSGVYAYSKDGGGVRLHEGSEYGPLAPPLASSIFVTDNSNPVLNGSFTVYDYIGNNDYWIYNPSSMQLYGPYNGDVNASYGLQILHDKELGPAACWQLSDQSVDGPFWAEDEDGFTIYSEDGSKSLDGFDRVLVISRNAIGGFKGRQFILYDKDLNKVYEAYSDGGAMPVNGIIPLMDGESWKLIRVRSKDGSESQKPEDSEAGQFEDKAREEDPEPSEDIDEDKALAMAKEYWNDPNPEDCAIISDDGNPISINGVKCYHFWLKARVDGHLSTVDEVWINTASREMTYEKPR